MSFKPKWTEEAARAFRELERVAAHSMRRKGVVGAKASKAQGLFKQVEKCVRLLLDNPRHTGLHTHEYTSIDSPFDSSGKVFETNVQNRTPGAYRLFLCYGPDKGEITIIAITPHP